MRALKSSCKSGAEKMKDHLWCIGVAGLFLFSLRSSFHLKEELMVCELRKIDQNRVDRKTVKYFQKKTLSEFLLTQSLNLFTAHLI